MFPGSSVIMVPQLSLKRDLT